MAEPTLIADPDPEGTRRFDRERGPLSRIFDGTGTFVRGDESWRRQLAFRDYLRAHEDAACAYDLLKQHLAGARAGDRRGDTATKGLFVRSVLRAAAAGEPLFEPVVFGDPRYDGPYLRVGRNAFDGPERTRAQTDSLEILLRMPASARILDAGCGIGTYTRELSRRGYRAVGLDISATFLQQARRGATARESPVLLRSSFHSLPFRDSFDAVLITAAPLFANIDQLRVVCRQVRSVLRPGGRFLFNYPNWTIRGRAERFPQLFGQQDGEGLVLERVDWDGATRVWRFDWYRLDFDGGGFLRSGAVQTGVSPCEVAGTVGSTGFRRADVFAVWDLDGRLPDGAPRPFDETADRGFVLVATSPT